MQRDRGGKSSGVGSPEWVAGLERWVCCGKEGDVGRQKGQLQHNCVCWLRTRWPFLVSALVPLLSSSDTRREAPGVAKKAGTLGSDRHRLKS